MLATIGHNSPPEILAFASETMTALSDWMKEHPVIEGEADARQAKLLLDRAKNCTAEIEAERDKQVRPLNTQIDAINSKYKAVHNKDSKRPGSLDRVVNELKARVTAWLQAEEDRRLAEAEAKRRTAEEAERAARIAEEKEREAIANAAAGELGVDVTQVVVAADKTFAELEKADRAAAIAEKDSHVKLGGGFGRVTSLRNSETLILNSWFDAIACMGVSEKLESAILSAARDYRREFGKLPAGVSSVVERHV